MTAKAIKLIFDNIIGKDLLHALVKPQIVGYDFRVLPSLSIVCKDHVAVLNIYM